MKKSPESRISAFASAESRTSSGVFGNNTRENLRRVADTLDTVSYYGGIFVAGVGVIISNQAMIVGGAITAAWSAFSKRFINPIIGRKREEAPSKKVTSPTLHLNRPMFGAAHG